MQRTVSRMSRKSARLSAFSVDRQRMPGRGLHAEAVQHRAEDVVVVKAIDQRFVAATISSVTVP